MQVDSIKIECEDDGFHLVVLTDAAHHDFRIQSCAEALHEQVNLIIGGWLAEGQAAARTFRCDPDESGGFNLSTRQAGIDTFNRLAREAKEAYEATNPKHPNYHSVHADLYDNREKV